MRRATMKKKNEGNQTGAAGQTLTQLDNIILDVIGQDSSYLQGLHQRDDPPVFASGSTENNINLLNTSSFSMFESVNHSFVPSIARGQTIQRSSTPAPHSTGIAKLYNR